MFSGEQRKTADRDLSFVTGVSLDGMCSEVMANNGVSPKRGEARRLLLATDEHSDEHQCSPRAVSQAAERFLKPPFPLSP